MRNERGFRPFIGTERPNLNVRAQNRIISGTSRLANPLSFREVELAILDERAIARVPKDVVGHVLEQVRPQATSLLNGDYGAEVRSAEDLVEHRTSQMQVRIAHLEKERPRRCK